METNSRSLMKAISYRLLGSFSTAAIFFIMTRQATLSVGAGLLDMVVKIAMYYLHERIWDRIHFGRSKPPEYEI